MPFPYTFPFTFDVESGLRLKLSDGTTTIDLYGGSDTLARYAGLRIYPPLLDHKFLSNPLYDGDGLISSRFGNRTIAITTKISGSSDLPDLRTNIRTIERLLNDARQHRLLGYGSTVYLEYQWANVDGESIYFDVLDGELILPPDFYNVYLTSKYHILDAHLTFICKPFGRYANQDIVADTLENSQSIYEMEDSYEDSTITDHVIINNANDWEAQTLSVTSSYTCTGASIKGVREGSPGDIVIALYATTAGKPSGSALATGTVDVDSISTDTAYPSWINVVFDTPVAVTNGITYAIVVHGDSCTVINQLKLTNRAGVAGDRVYSTDGGSVWNIDATRDFMYALYSQESHTNYQDIITGEGHGDVAAKLYHKIIQTGATGSKKIWIAKRSGTRQTDSLWLEGEAYTDYTDIIGVPHIKLITGQPLNNVSNGRAIEVDVYSGNIAADTEIMRFNYTIATVPRGQFRLLVRCKVTSDDTADYDHMGFGFGWSYGTKTKTPSNASSEYYACAADDTWKILDLGEIMLPPIAESDIASNNSLELRLYLYAIDILTLNEHYIWYIDYIFLLPIDEGVIIVDALASTDRLAIDGLTDPPNVFFIDASEIITDYPDYIGRPFTLGRENTRLYILRDDLKTVTFSSNVKYQPQFLMV